MASNALTARATQCRSRLPGPAAINHPVTSRYVDGSRLAELARGSIAASLDGGGFDLILEVEGRTALLSTQVFLRTSARPRARRVSNIRATAVTVAG